MHQTRVLQDPHGLNGEMIYPVMAGTDEKGCPGIACAYGLTPDYPGEGIFVMFFEDDQWKFEGRLKDAQTFAEFIQKGVCEQGAFRALSVSIVQGKLSCLLITRVNFPVKLMKFILGLLQCLRNL